MHLAILDVIDNPEKTQQTTAIGTWQKSGLDLAEINYAFWIDKMHELEITINTDARFVVRQTENGWRHLFGSGSFAVDKGLRTDCKKSNH